MAKSAPKEISIADRLKAAGYSYRPSRLSGARQVFNTKTGEVVGDLFVDGAVRFLKSIAA